MAIKEKNLINETLLSLPSSMRMFRINCGMAWIGKIVKRIKNKIIIENPRVFHGAPSGFPDLAGWKTITITSDMIGKKIAIFTGYEIKATGDLSNDQKRFKKLLIESGGIFKTIRNS